MSHEPKCNEKVADPVFETAHAKVDQPHIKVAEVCSFEQFLELVNEVKEWHHGQRFV